MFVARAATVAATGCALGLIAFVFDAAPLFVPAVALTALGAAAPLWVWGATRGASAGRRMSAQRVIEHEELEATITVHRGRLGLPGAEVVDPLTSTRFELGTPLSPWLEGRDTSVRVVTRFTRRGLHRVPAPWLTACDPLGLARARTETGIAAQELLVLPAVEPVHWLHGDHGRRLHLTDGNDGAETRAAVELDGLRAYREGTPASRIHWPAVARGAGLLERHMRGEGDSRPLVVLDARGEVAIELLDAAVRAAGSLALELGRSDGCGLLLPGDQRPTIIDRELAAWPGAHARLALVHGGPNAIPPALASAAGRSGPMIYVAAAPAPRMSALLATPRNGQIVLVLPVASLVEGLPPGVRVASQPVLSVSGCRGFVLGVARGRRRAAGPDGRRARA